MLLQQIPFQAPGAGGPANSLQGNFLGIAWFASLSDLFFMTLKDNYIIILMINEHNLDSATCVENLTQGMKKT